MSRCGQCQHRTDPGSYRCPPKVCIAAYGSAQYYCKSTTQPSDVTSTIRMCQQCQQLYSCLQMASDASQSQWRCLASTMLFKYDALSSHRARFFCTTTSKTTSSNSNFAAAAPAERCMHYIAVITCTLPAAGAGATLIDAVDIAARPVAVPMLVHLLQWHAAGVSAAINQVTRYVHCISEASASVD